MAKTINLENFKGGLSTINPENVEDNQFTILRNMFYNSEKRIQTRKGIKTFGSPIPDSVLLINACDATTNFAVTDDATTLATGTAIRGTFAVSFMIDVSASGSDFATLTNASLGTIDITGEKGYLGFWVNVPTGFNTNLTDVKVRLGSDSTNYYEWTLPTITEATDQFIRLNYADATLTGTPVDTTIDFFRLQVTYTGAYLDQVGVRIDDINSYSLTSTSPTTSIFFYQRDDTRETILLAVAGSNMFHYNETSTNWDIIKTGLTEFETLTGQTTFRTRWSFAVYFNIIYMCNGVDAYSSWDGVLFQTFGAQPKIRYLRFMGNRVFGGGEDANPITLYFTNALAADAETLNANFEDIGGDEQGKINGLKDLGQFTLVMKDKKIYSFNPTSSTSDGIDTQNGGYSHRTIHNVENGLLLFNDTGIDKLQQRSATTGQGALAGETLMADLNTFVRDIEPIQYNANAGYYIPAIFNYYFSFDRTNTNIPDTTLVYSSLKGVGSWSQYTFPALYDYDTYINSDGEAQYLISSATGGQLYEIETGFEDLGNEIPHELQTKEFDFGDSTIQKTYHNVDVTGLKSEGQDVTIEVVVEDEVVATGILTDSFLDISGGPITLGTTPIGIEPIGGGPAAASDELDLFKYLIRIPIERTGRNIQVRMISTVSPITWTLEKIKIAFDEETFDFFPFENIA